MNRRSLLILALVMLAATLVSWPTSAAAATGKVYYVNPSGTDGADGTSARTAFKTIQRALEYAQPSDTISLAAGVYLQDIISQRNGSVNAPITIVGPQDAVVKGGGNGRVFEINHDYLTLQGFTIDGLYGSSSRADGYRDKLLYVLGKQPRDGVNGLRLLGMTFKNAGGECVRLRYFARNNEIASSLFQNCGVHDFRFNAGGKNGEGIYIGTAPEQLGDGKNPTRDRDASNDNWIHHNTFNTQGNECVDIKEGASGNLVEQNSCTGQKDPESAGFDSRGNDNIFRANLSFGNLGAGVRLGGDTASDGLGNHVYGNTIHDNAAGGVKVQRMPQGNVCGNVLNNNRGGASVGTYAQQVDPQMPCRGPEPQPAMTTVTTPSPTVTTPSPTVATPSPTVATPLPSAATPQPSGTSCSSFYAVNGAQPLFIEAEQFGRASGRFVAVRDGDRSKGTYMQVPGQGMRNDAATYLEYQLDVRNGGSFFVWLLSYGPDSSSDSFSVQVNKDSSVQANLSQKRWGWKKASTRIVLGEGSQTLRIINREDGARVDKILLTKDQRFVPREQGQEARASECR